MQVWDDVKIISTGRHGTVIDIKDGRLCIELHDGTSVWLDECDVLCDCTHATDSAWE